MGITKIQTARQVLLALSLAAMVLCSWFALLDSPATKRVDAGLERALISFATARALNAVISVAQGTEIAIQPVGVGVNLTIGQVLDPINDLVEQFSSLMLVACVVFGIQKMLIVIGGYWPINLVLTIAALGWAWLYFRQEQSPAWLSKTLVILLMIRFAMPMVFIGTDLLFQKFLAADFKESQSVIDTAEGQIADLNSDDKIIEAKADQTAENKPDQVSEVKPEEGKGLFAWLKDGAKSFAGGVKNFVGGTKRFIDATATKVNLKQKYKEISDRTGQWVERIITLIVIFLLQTMIIPILLLWGMYAVLRGSFELPKQVTKAALAKV